MADMQTFAEESHHQIAAAKATKDSVSAPVREATETNAMVTANEMARLKEEITTEILDKLKTSLTSEIMAGVIETLGGKPLDNAERGSLAPSLQKPPSPETRPFSAVKRIQAVTGFPVRRGEI